MVNRWRVRTVRRGGKGRPALRTAAEVVLSVVAVVGWFFVPFLEFIYAIGTDGCGSPPTSFHCSNGGQVTGATLIVSAGWVIPIMLAITALALGRGHWLRRKFLPTSGVLELVGFLAAAVIAARGSG